MKPDVLFFVVCIAAAKAFRFFPGMSDLQNAVCSGADVVQLPQKDRDPECEFEATLGSCSFYSCFEERYPCQNCGYARNSICHRFFNPRFFNSFNAQGQNWINATSRCFTRTLLTLYTQDRLSCKQTIDLMRNATTTCFTNNDVISFCEVYQENHEEFLRVLGRRGFIAAIRLLNSIREVFGERCASSQTSVHVGIPVDNLHPRFPFH